MLLVKGTLGAIAETMAEFYQRRMLFPRAEL